MKLFLSEEYYSLAKSVDFAELLGHIHFNDIEKSIEVDDEKIARVDFFGEEYKEYPIMIMLGCISDEVIKSGLSDDQQKVLPRGRALYNLYDSIYYNL